MASRTQLRLQQVTGSAVDLKVEVGQYLNPSTAAALTGSDLKDILGAMGAAIQRIHGKAANEFLQQSEGTFDTSVFDVNTAGAFTVDAGANSEIATSAGTLTLDGKTGVNIQENNTTIIAVSDDRDITTTNTRQIHLDSTGLLNLNSSAGIINIGNDAVDQNINIGIDGARTINIGNEASGNTTAINIKALGADGSDVSIESAAGSVNITGGESAADSVKITGTGVQVLSSDTSNGLKLATGTSGVPVTIGHTTSETTIADNLNVTGDTTIAGDLIVQGATTTVSSSNLVIQDSIIGLGFSGSSDTGLYQFNNLGDRAIIFGRAANTTGAFLPALNYDGSEFEFGTFNASPSSASMGTHQAGLPVRTGNLKPISDDGASLGDADERWSDLFLANGGVINFNNGNFRLTHSANALTIDTDDKLQFRDANTFIHSNDANDMTLAATDITVDAGGDIELNAAGNDITFKSAANTVGKIVMDHGSAGLILSASATNTLVLDSSMGFIQMTQNAAEGGSNGASFVLGSNALQIEGLNYDPEEGATAFKFAVNDTYAQQFLQISGSLRLYKSNAGDRYVAIDVGNPGSNYNLTLPDAVPSTNNEILISDTSGNLSFATQAELGIGAAASKGVKIITTTVSAGTAVNFNSVDAGDTISGLSQASSQGASVDLYVNGQLLISGSATQRAAGTRDYDIEATGTTVKFAFDLEPDDVVQLIKR